MTRSFRATLFMVWFAFLSGVALWEPRTILSDIFLTVSIGFMLTYSALAALCEWKDDGR